MRRAMGWRAMGWLLALSILGLNGNAVGQLTERPGRFRTTQRVAATCFGVPPNQGSGGLWDPLCASKAQFETCQYRCYSNYVPMSVAALDTCSPDRTWQPFDGASLCVAPCTKISCSTNGFCASLPWGPRCMCTSSDVVGETCSVSPNQDCFQKACSGNGLCVMENGLPKCQCFKGFQNSDCSAYVPCAVKACGLGLCVTVRTGVLDVGVCECPQSVTGVHCELNSRSPCFNNPCAFGTCIEFGVQGSQGSQGYRCLCLPGFRGVNCEVRAGFAVSPSQFYLDISEDCKYGLQSILGAKCGSYVGASGVIPQDAFCSPGGCMDAYMKATITSCSPYRMHTMALFTIPCATSTWNTTARCKSSFEAFHATFVGASGLAGLRPLPNISFHQDLAKLTSFCGDPCTNIINKEYMRIAAQDTKSNTGPSGSHATYLSMQLSRLCHRHGTTYCAERFGFLLDYLNTFGIVSALANQQWVMGACQNRCFRSQYAAWARAEDTFNQRLFSGVLVDTSAPQKWDLAMSFAKYLCAVDNQNNVCIEWARMTVGAWRTARGPSCQQLKQMEGSCCLGTIIRLWTTYSAVADPNVQYDRYVQSCQATNRLNVPAECAASGRANLTLKLAGDSQGFLSSLPADLAEDLAALVGLPAQWVNVFRAGLYVTVVVTAHNDKDAILARDLLNIMASEREGRPKGDLAGLSLFRVARYSTGDVTLVAANSTNSTALVDNTTNWVPRTPDSPQEVVQFDPEKVTTSSTPIVLGILGGILALCILGLVAFTIQRRVQRKATAHIRRKSMTEGNSDAPPLDDPPNEPTERESPGPTDWDGEEQQPHGTATEDFGQESPPMDDYYRGPHQYYDTHTKDYDVGGP